ncbi:MAG: hypothetical protein H6Q04_3201 [Acidobacteria bacterium]|nr:hypothetical protein [Acidobacteriota bacterium]
MIISLQLSRSRDVGNYAKMLIAGSKLVFAAGLKFLRFPSRDLSLNPLVQFRDIGTGNRREVTAVTFLSSAHRHRAR